MPSKIQAQSLDLLLSDVSRWNSHRLSDPVRIDLLDADLSGANLAGVNLVGVDLTGADLSGACLTSHSRRRATDLS